MKINLIVKFAGIDLVNDTITAVDGVSIINGVSPIGLVVPRPDYEILTEFDGSKVIVFHQSVAELKTLEINGATLIAATEFVGGRPNDR